MSNPDAAANEAECKCDCNRNTWANIMCGLGAGCGALITTCSIVSLLVIPDVPTFILCVFTSIFGLVLICAELRRFKAIRGLIWHIVKFIYFITAYTGRGLFYFFCGTIMFKEDSVLNIITTAFACTVGVMLIIVNIIYKLPVYLDPQMMKMEMEARMKEEAEAKAAAVYEQKLAAERAAMQQANNATAAASDAAANAHATVNMGGNSSDAPPYSPPHLS